VLSCLCERGHGPEFFPWTWHEFNTVSHSGLFMCRRLFGHPSFGGLNESPHGANNPLFIAVLLPLFMFFPSTFPRLLFPLDITRRSDFPPPPSTPRPRPTRTRENLIVNSLRSREPPQFPMQRLASPLPPPLAPPSQKLGGPP